jgi:enoyl-CoA hydratase/carnithine racemase
VFAELANLQNTATAQYMELARMSESENLRVERRDDCLDYVEWCRHSERACCRNDGRRNCCAEERAISDDNVRAVLFTGAGDRVFGAGADVREKPDEGDIAAHRKRRSAGLAALLEWRSWIYPNPLSPC